MQVWLNRYHHYFLMITWKHSVCSQNWVKLHNRHWTLFGDETPLIILHYGHFNLCTLYCFAAFTPKAKKHFSSKNKIKTIFGEIKMQSFFPPHTLILGSRSFKNPDIINSKLQSHSFSRARALTLFCIEKMSVLLGFKRGKKRGWKNTS